MRLNKVAVVTKQFTLVVRSVQDKKVCSDSWFKVSVAVTFAWLDIVVV